MESLAPVLFVDDDRSNLLLVRMGFQLAPVLIAPNAEEALEILAATRVSAVVSDQRMPGLSGTELAERVRAGWPEVPRMLITAYPEAPEVQEALRTGLVARVLAKPCRLEQLTRVLAELLGR